MTGNSFWRSVFRQVREVHRKPVLTIFQSPSTENNQQNKVARKEVSSSHPLSLAISALELTSTAMSWHAAFLFLLESTTHNRTSAWELAHASSFQPMTDGKHLSSLTLGAAISRFPRSFQVPPSSFKPRTDGKWCINSPSSSSSSPWVGGGNSQARILHCFLMCPSRLMFHLPMMMSVLLPFPISLLHSSSSILGDPLPNWGFCT